MTPAALDRARRQLATPPGLPGSGRLRYAAAMALHAAGEMSFAALEVYRVLSMTDAEDPAAVLRARRLRVAPEPAEDPLVDLFELAGELAQCLAEVPLPGAAEVRAAFAEARRTGAVGPLRLTDPPAVVGDQLPVVLAELAPLRPLLASMLAAGASSLAWQSRPQDSGRAAWAPVLGQDGPWRSDRATLGLVLAAPGAELSVPGPPAALTLVLPLSGAAGSPGAGSAAVALRPGRTQVPLSGERPVLALIATTAAPEDHTVSRVGRS